MKLKKKHKRKLCKLYLKILIKHKRGMNKFLETFPPEYWNRQI
jgi:hypothetical protein